MTNDNNYYQEWSYRNRNRGRNNYGGGGGLRRGGRLKNPYYFVIYHELKKVFESMEFGDDEVVQELEQNFNWMFEDFVQVNDLDGIDLPTDLI